MDILICDDEPLAVERLSRLVTQLGHHVVATASHGQQAIRAWLKALSLMSSYWIFKCLKWMG